MEFEYSHYVTVDNEGRSHDINSYDTIDIALVRVLTRKGNQTMENIRSEKLSRQAREWLAENSDKVDQILEDLRTHQENSKSRNIIQFPAIEDKEFE